MFSLQSGVYLKPGSCNDPDQHVTQQALVLSDCQKKIEKENKPLYLSMEKSSVRKTVMYCGRFTGRKVSELVEIYTRDKTRECAAH
jgi:hypothetical protein